MSDYFNDYGLLFKKLFSGTYDGVKVY